MASASNLKTRREYVPVATHHFDFVDWRIPFTDRLRLQPHSALGCNARQHHDAGAAEHRTLFNQLEEGHDPSYEASKDFYVQTEATLRALLTRAQAVPKAIS